MNNLFRSISKNRLKVIIVGTACIALGIAACNNSAPTTETKNIAAKDTLVFQPPDTATIPHDDMGNMIRYGRDLVVNTAYYLGPNGTVGKYLGNKMNCTNCHLDAGTRPFGYNFFSTHARYPQYRGRENKILTVSDRINNCIERPHNGTPMPLDSKELIAMASYIKWVGTNAPVGGHVRGDEGMELEYINRPADPNKGAVIFAENCASCHGKNGEGIMKPDSSTYVYPPLWGPLSYQKGSSPHRVLKVARFIKANMPNLKATWQKPVLTDEQCIDVAAFVNDDRIHPRPEKRNREVPDYPQLKVKPIDYGTGPYLDTFTAIQHKFGPYKPIIDYHKSHNLPVVF
jgi:thiosulfate dehydrogenase